MLTALEAFSLPAHVLRELTQLRDLGPIDLSVLQVQGKNNPDKPSPTEPRSEKTRPSLRDEELYCSFFQGAIQPRAPAHGSGA